MYVAASRCKDIARTAVTNWEPRGVTLAGCRYALRHGMKVQLVTPYRVSHLQRYGVTVRCNVISVCPPLLFRSYDFTNGFQTFPGRLSNLFSRTLCWFALLYKIFFTWKNEVVRYLTLGRRVLKKPQLSKKFPEFYRTPRFKTVFTTACHMHPSSASPIQSTPSHPII